MKTITTIILIAIILIFAGMYGYSKYSQNQTRKSVESFLRGEGESEQGKVSESSNEMAGKAQKDDSSELFAGKIILTPENTKLAWIGRKTFVVGYEDAGSIDIQSGEVEIKDGKIVSALATVDMLTIKTLKSSNNKGEDALTRHLNSEDFFDTKKYPVSKLVITKSKLLSENNGAQNYEFSGNLTIKGITADVSFLGTATVGNDVVNAQSEMKIDRTKWGVNYGSSKLANAFIDDLFDLKININAKIK